MATRRTTKTAAPASKSARRGAQDAVALLKADHRQVADWFAEFEKSRSDGKKANLAASICEALTVHMRIEEQVFYPAFLEATGDQDLHHEAEIEHAGAKNLISQIQEMGPNDEYFDARVKVLSEMIKHHVKEEEQPGGMFAEAKASDMDLVAVGDEMQASKDQLLGKAEAA